MLVSDGWFAVGIGHYQRMNKHKEQLVNKGWWLVVVSMGQYWLFQLIYSIHVFFAQVDPGITNPRLSRGIPPKVMIP